MEEVVTRTKPKRLIYFSGHPNENKSVLITQVCKNYKTIFEIYKLESATRTLNNLYNLCTVRGLTNIHNQLIFKSSMSGPHHYFGYLNPFKYHTITFDKDNMPVYTEYEYRPELPLIDFYTKVSLACNPLKTNQIVSVHNYNWINGKDIAKSNYKLNHEYNSFVNVDTGEKDSLFDNPGILEFTEETLVFPVIQNAYKYNLADFKAQIVKNDTPFQFNQTFVNQYPHAQNRLRVVTYNYGDRYLEDYLMQRNGVFIEQHEFIQAITPMNEKCGGYVLLGRKVNDRLDLIAVTIPFGYTLLVDAFAIHGDSTLTGLYMMAMTGNHIAMRTADTVFIKNKTTHNNVRMETTPVLEKVNGLSGDNFLVTSDEMSLKSIKAKDASIKKDILRSVGIKALWWRPVILTLNKTLGWTKTIGTSLPHE